MKEMTYQEMQQLQGGMTQLQCAGLGFTFGVGLFGGPVGWVTSAFSLGLAIEGGCFN
jgi:uncharacterized protein YaaW (UPF0174 family)